MHAGNPFVEDQGVGDDGACHAAGLRHVCHPQQTGNSQSDARASLVQLVQEPCGAVDAVLERGGCLVHGALWYGHQAHHVNQVLDRSL